VLERWRQRSAELNCVLLLVSAVAWENWPMVLHESFVARSLGESRSAQSSREPATSRGDDGSRREPEGQRLPARDRRRTKMISFRVSEREFEQLRVRSEADGARNISEYARMALCEGPKSSDADLQRLSSEIQRLGADLARVTLLIEQGTSRITPHPADPKRE